MKTVLLLLAAAGLAACSAPLPESKHDNVPSPTGRVYNPASRSYEWNTPGNHPVSPGDNSTSRSPYH